MGNRDRRDDKVKKPKKSDKQSAGHVHPIEILPPVEVVKRKRRKDEFSTDED